MEDGGGLLLQPVKVQKYCEHSMGWDLVARLSSPADGPAKSILYLLFAVVIESSVSLYPRTNLY